MHLHKWSKWEQVVVHLTRIHQGKTYHGDVDRQERFCEKCGKVQRIEV